jgi:hypothetical protein
MHPSAAWAAASDWRGFSFGAPGEPDQHLWVLGIGTAAIPAPPGPQSCAGRQYGGDIVGWRVNQQALVRFPDRVGKLPGLVPASGQLCLAIAPPSPVFCHLTNSISVV